MYVWRLSLLSRQFSNKNDKSTPANVAEKVGKKIGIISHGIRYATTHMMTAKVT